MRVLKAVLAILLIAGAPVVHAQGDGGPDFELLKLIRMEDGTVLSLTGSERGVAEITQEGNNNTSQILQTSTGPATNFAGIGAYGSLNHAVISQLGQGNATSVLQEGDNNSVTATIQGDCNLLEVTQRGNSNSVDQTITADAVGIIVTQTGDGNSLTQVNNSESPKGPIKVDMTGGMTLILTNGAPLP